VWPLSCNHLRRLSRFRPQGTASLPCAMVLSLAKVAFINLIMAGVQFESTTLG
jgi:hypothetical protein